MPQVNRGAEKTVAIVFQIRLWLIIAKRAFQPHVRTQFELQILICCITCFLRARNHDLASASYPLNFRVSRDCFWWVSLGGIELGKGWAISNSLEIQSEGSRDICRRRCGNQGHRATELTVRR